MITAAEALTPSTPEDVEDVREIVEVALRVFAAEKAAELPSSKLIEKLKELGVEISTKRFKTLMRESGIRLYRHSDANYYHRADFVAASAAIVPSLHPSIVPPSTTLKKAQQSRVLDAFEIEQIFE